MTGVGNDWKWKVRGQVGDIGKWGLFNAESVSGKSPKTDRSIKKCRTSSENPSTRHVGRGSGYMMVIQEVRFDKHRLHSESSCIDAEQSRQYPASCALTIELLQKNAPLW